MKTTIIGVLALLVVGGIAVYSGQHSTVEYERPPVETVEVMPDWAEIIENDEEAKAAAMAVIRKKDVQAQLADVESQIAELESKRTELEKELSF